MNYQQYEPVDMPGKKVTFKKGKNGTVYAYITTKAYRNAKGKPTSDEMIIGKKDLQTGKLLPNPNYFKRFGKEPKPSLVLPDKIESCGTSAVLLQAASETGLLKTLKKTFPDDWEELLSYAMYMVCEGNVMEHCGDWKDSTKTIFKGVMSSFASSALFSSLTFEKRMAFMREWCTGRDENEYIAYDVTSVSTYANNIDDAEYGYNRDKEKLPQINIGMFFGEQSGLPLFYNSYSGSITDKSHLVFMMSGAKELGISKVRFVLDQGFVSETNCQYMFKHGLPFITCLPGSRIEAKKLMDIALPVLRSSANWIKEFNLYGIRMPYKLYGIEMSAHVFFNPEKMFFDELKIYSSVDQLGNELSKLTHAKGTAKRYTELFDVTPEKKLRTLAFKENHEKIDGKLKHAGLVVFITSDTTVSSKEIILWYRSRDMVEKCFDDLKNNLDFKRLKTHFNKTTDGKLFVGFLALILRSYVMKCINKIPRKKRPSSGSIMRELKKIRMLTFSSKTKMMLPLTAIQKSLLSVFAVDDTTLEANASNDFLSFFES